MMLSCRVLQSPLRRATDLLKVKPWLGLGFVSRTYTSLHQLPVWTSESSLTLQFWQQALFPTSITVLVSCPIAHSMSVLITLSYLHWAAQPAFSYCKQCSPRNFKARSQPTAVSFCWTTGHSSVWIYHWWWFLSLVSSDRAVSVAGRFVFRAVGGRLESTPSSCVLTCRLVSSCRHLRWCLALRRVHL